jgi:hypothetical protein
MDPNIREKVNTIIEKIKELRSQGINESYELEMYFIHNMTEFFDNYPYIIKRLCREENQDNTFLFKMIDMLEKVNVGEKSLASVELNLSEELAGKYLYPVLQKENEAKAAQEKEKTD